MVTHTPIVITGGHPTPALAVVELLQKSRKYAVHFIGRKNAGEGDAATSLEYTVCRKLKIPFYSISAARFQRFVSIWSVYSLVKFPIGLIQSFYLLAKIKPVAVLSFGGYVALPVSIAAACFKIPILIHEQTTVFGLTNKIMAPVARWVCVSWKTTKGIPKSVSTIYTGNPLRESMLREIRSRMVHFGDEHLPLVYITGGSMGSTSINEKVRPLIAQLVQRFRVLHQCGSSYGQRDYRHFLTLKNSLPFAYKKNYQVVKHIDQSEVAAVLKECYFAISRSGANTITELLVKGVPSILIPLPWAGENEQNENANILKSLGSAIVLDQHETTSEGLLQKINYLSDNRDEIKKNADRAISSVPVNAAEKIVSLVDTLSE